MTTKLLANKANQIIITIKCFKTFKKIVSKLMWKNKIHYKLEMRKKNRKKINTRKKAKTDRRAANFWGTRSKLLNIM